MSVSPYSFQNITYENQFASFGSRSSAYGCAFGLGLTYNYNQRFGFCGNVSYEYHNFENFHKYRDLKSDLRLRLRYLTTDSYRNKFYFELGCGVDCVFRDDSDFGCYGMMLIFALKNEHMIGSDFSINYGCDLTFTLQTGSEVLHVTPFVGATYQWGN